MTKTKNKKILRKQRTSAAADQFEQYKIQIVEDFVRKFGGSYQIPQQHLKTWRKTFAWSQERVDFLLKKTVDFLRFLPYNPKIYDSLQCLDPLIINIANHLAVYTCREKEKDLKPGEFINRKPYQEFLKNYFLNQDFIQTRIKSFSQQNTPTPEKQAKKEAKRKKAELKKQEQIKKEQRKRFAETGEIPPEGYPFHTSQELLKLQIEYYGLGQERS